MTVSSTVRVAGPYIGTGLVATYPFTFKVFQASDLLVVENVSGVQSTLNLTTDYTVALNADQNNNPGGSITLVAGNLPVGETVTLSSQVAQLQGLNITNFSAFLPSVITNALDYLTILVQQLSTTLGRAMTFPLSDGTSLTTQLPPAASRANLFLSFDSLGQPTISAGLSSVSVSSAMVPVVGSSTIQNAAELILNGNIASSAPPYSDTNVLSELSGNVNSYAQSIINNRSNGATASADVVVANNLGTATTFYGNFGMNSSGFTGSGNFNKASAVYLTATSGDLVIGTTTANAIHFVYNGSTTDTCFIDNTGLNVITQSPGNNSTRAASTAYADASATAAASAALTNGFASQSWTPVLNINSATTGITYTTQVGKYVQVGKFIIAEFTIILPRRVRSPVTSQSPDYRQTLRTLSASAILITTRR